MYTDVPGNSSYNSGEKKKAWKLSKCLMGKWLSKQWDYYIAIKNDRGEDCVNMEKSVSAGTLSGKKNTDSV